MMPRPDALPAFELARTQLPLEALPLPLLAIDGQRIVFANEAASRLFLAPSASLLERSPWELFHPASIEPARERLKSLVAGVSSVATADERIVCADGQIRCVSTTAMLTVAGGRPLQLLLLHDVSELRATQDALQHSQTELRGLAAAREATQDTERERVGRVLHDGLLQPLGALRMALGSMSMHEGSPGDDVAIALQRADGLVQTAMNTARGLINELQPLMLLELGLGSALEALAGRFGIRTGLLCRYRGAAAAEPLADRDAALCLYRVAQDLLENVERHAAASKVLVQLGESGDCLVLRVRDDGVGLRETDRDHPGAFGLLSIRERLHALGGSLRVDARRHRGTTVEARLPLQATKRGASVSARELASSAFSRETDSSALLRFLYRTPIGLVQARLDGHIDMANPVAIQMLLPLAPEGDLANLFDLLQGVAPRLRAMTESQRQPAAVICESLLLQLPAGLQKQTRKISLNVLKQDGLRLMAVLSDTEPHIAANPRPKADRPTT